MRIGFDHDQYTAMQSEHIRQRIDTFGGKLSGQNLWHGLTVQYRYVAPQKEVT